MARSRRVVVPDVPHHVVARGNRQQAIFFSDANRRMYLTLLGEALQRHATRCLAWCLMSNHVHLILTPSREDGLRAPLASAHTAYSQRINREQGASGHLFQGRFASFPMEPAHLVAAVRYVENNPVTAGLVVRAQDWPWSSARAHLTASPDGLIDVVGLRELATNWSAYLRDGAEAADRDEALELQFGGYVYPPPRSKRGRKPKVGAA